MCGRKPEFLKGNVAKGIFMEAEDGRTKDTEGWGEGEGEAKALQGSIHREGATGQ